MGSKRLDEMDTESVRSVFDNGSPIAWLIEEGTVRLKTQRPFQFAAAAAVLFAVFMIGFAIGGGFSSSTAANVVADNGGLFISNEQAADYQQQAIDLEDTRGQLTVAEGDAAFQRSQVAALTEDSAQLRSALNQVRLEMDIVVGIYEECLGRLQPLKCIENARSDANDFLAELYGAQQ